VRLGVTTALLRAVIEVFRARRVPLASAVGEVTDRVSAVCGQIELATAPQDGTQLGAPMALRPVEVLERDDTFTWLAISVPGALYDHVAAVRGGPDKALRLIEAELRAAFSRLDASCRNGSLAGFAAAQHALLTQGSGLHVAEPFSPTPPEPPVPWALGDLPPEVLPVSLETAQATATRCYEWEQAEYATHLLERLARLGGSTSRSYKAAFHGAQQRLLAATHDFNAAAEAARHEFAARRGWKYLGRSQCSVEGLKEGRVDAAVIPAKTWKQAKEHAARRTLIVDHDESYVDPGDYNLPRAIVSHTYSTRAQVEAFAEEQGLGLEVLTYSWYFPVGCTAVVFTRAASQPITDDDRPAASGSGEPQ